MKNKDLKSYKNFVIENIEFNISGEKIKKGDIVEVDINGIKAKFKVVISKKRGIGEYNVELKRIKGE